MLRLQGLPEQSFPQPYYNESINEDESTGEKERGKDRRIYIRAGHKRRLSLFF